MAEYIDREAFKKSVEERYCKPCKAAGKDHNGCWCRACWVDDMLDEVECFQHSDVVPVVYGRWITSSDRPDTLICSKYINKLALLAHIKDLPTWWADAGGYYGGAQKLPDGLFEPEDIIASIENAPSVDVVPVGRCRDCAKYHAEIAWCDEWSCFEKDGEPCDPADSMQWRELEPEEYCSRFQGKEKNV